MFSSCDSIMTNFVLLKQVVEKLENSYFEFLTDQQICEQKNFILQDLELDTAFKLLTKLEAEIKQDFLEAIADKKKDELSKQYLQLCRNFRIRIAEYQQPLPKICRKVALDDILEEVKACFKNANPVFSKNCSALKGHFKFRHWYAHGRYFQRTPVPPAPREVQQLCNEFKQFVFDRK